MNKFNWYIARFKTMSIAEVFYRAKQFTNNSIEKISPRTPSFKSVTINRSFKLAIDDFAQGQQIELTKYSFFHSELDITGPIDFHKDISSGKSFPMVYAKGINIRSDEYGNAKLVWEINRLQFLLPMVMQYQITRDGIFLTRFIDIMTSWDKQNPYLQGVNWYSNIEVNLRLINWYWCWLILDSCEELENNDAFNNFKYDVWLPLIYKHCYYSFKNPSYYSSANNHLISEYAGLFVASTLWKFPESEKWLNYAKEGLEKEIVNQHSSGINKEEAAEYIQFITDLFLLPYIAGQHFNIGFSAIYERVLFEIAVYINNFLDSKGNFPKYGDEDDGKVMVADGDASANNFISILNTVAVLFNKPFLVHPGASWDLKSSLLTGHAGGYDNWKKFGNANNLSRSKFYMREGHFIFKKTEIDLGEIYMHFDAAPLGYLSIAAHGHADALSVILHVDGQPFLVDPGTYTYHTDEQWRKYFVSTKAHNTIAINNTDQAEHAGPTLWLNHFNVKVEDCIQRDNYDKVTASHDGYKSINGKHTRAVQFDKIKNSFCIEDIVENPGRHDVRMYWHLHPSIKTDRLDNVFLLTDPNGRQVKITVDEQFEYSIAEGNVNPIVGWYSPSFLKKEPTKVIVGISKNITKTLIIKTLIEIIR